MSKAKRKSSGLPIINERAAAIDIGSRFHVAAVGPDRCAEPVQTFQAFTGDLQRMANWLTETGVKAVVMESTGVYWVPVPARPAPCRAARAMSMMPNGCSACMPVVY